MRTITRLGDMPVAEFLDDPRRKQQYVTAMFEIIAPEYDRFTRLFSFGMDASWKIDLVAEAFRELPEHATVLDLACGTGDIAIAIAGNATGGRVLGLDAAPNMIAIANQRAALLGVSGLSFALGDMMRIDLPERSVDLVTIGYGLRNVPDPNAALREIARVLKPGGRLLSLDFMRPENPLWRACFLAYLRVAGDIVGWFWHRDPAVYGYIARSISRFVSAGELSAMMLGAGLRVRKQRRRLLGGVCLHLAENST